MRIPNSVFRIHSLQFALLACLSLPLFTLRSAATPVLRSSPATADGEDGRAAQPWREITVPTVAEAAASFARPPMDYGAIHWAIWGGPQTKERIIADIDRIHANGGGVYMINNSRGVQPKYLSPEYMDLVKTVVQECKKNGMKVWIEGDCGYPDGFAGGLISQDYPQLGMQGIVADAHCTVAAGQTLDIPLPPDTLGIVARPRPVAVAPPADAPAPTGKPFPLPADGNFKYSVPRGGAGELTVQLPNADVRYNLTVGEPFAIQLPPDTKGIMLVASGGTARGAVAAARARMRRRAPWFRCRPTDISNGRHPQARSPGRLRSSDTLTGPRPPGTTMGKTVVSPRTRSTR